MSLISPEIGQIPTSPPFLSVIAQSIMWRSIRYSIAWYLPEAALASFRHRVAKIQHRDHAYGHASGMHTRYA